ncbi:MAG: hypothetical protein WC553_01855 [Patescibacteria group bacterium]
MAKKFLVFVVLLIILLGAYWWMNIHKPALVVTADNQPVSSLSGPDKIGAYIDQDWGSPLPVVAISKVFEGKSEMYLDISATTDATWRKYGAEAYSATGSFEFYFYPAGQLAQVFGKRALRVRAIDNTESGWSTEALRYSGDIKVDDKEVAWFVASDWPSGRYLIAYDTDAALSLEGMISVWPNQVWLVECR